MRTLVVMVTCLVVLAVAHSVGATQPVKLPEKTSVRVAILENLVSGQGKPNDAINFELREDLYGPDREVLATKGTPATGHIIRTKRRGIFGRSGKLDFSCDYTKGVDGTKISLRGTEIRSGKGNGGAVVATALVVSVFGLFINGRDVKVDKGAEFTVYVAEDTMIDPSRSPANAAAATTYTIALSPDAMRELAQKIGAAKPSPEGNVTTVAVAEFELIPEKEGTRLDTMVARNARDDLALAVGSIAGFKVVERTEWDRALEAPKVDLTKPMDANTAKTLGTQVNAQYVLLGSISDRGAIVVVNARLVDTKTGENACSVFVDVPKSGAATPVATGVTSTPQAQ